MGGHREANTSQDSYAGAGVYRSTNDGASYQRVGDDSSGNNPLVSHTVFQLAFDRSGNAYAGTDDGLFRYDAGTGKWTEVLAPAPVGDATRTTTTRRPRSRSCPAQAGLM